MKRRFRARVVSVSVVLCLAAVIRTAHGSYGSQVDAADPGTWVEAVTALYQDRAGFLWVGSREGLILYDGYSSILFEHDVSDRRSLGDNAIRTVYEDRAGHLWIGTNTGGLDRLDRSTWIFDHYRHDSGDPRSLSHDSVYAIAEDRDGGIWVGTQRGLNRLDPSTGVFERFPAGTDGPADDYIAALRIGDDGALWVATVDGGLARRDPSSGRFSQYRHDPSDPRSLISDHTYAIAADRRGDLWIATDAGLCRMRVREGTFDAVPFESDPGSSETITSVAVDDGGTVWAGAFDAGLWRLDSGAGALVRNAFRTGVVGGATNRINSLLADRQGNLWVGTWGGGLGRLSRASRLIDTLTENGVSPGGAAPNVTGVFEDRAGGLWVGGYSAFLVRREPLGEIRRYGFDAAPLGFAEGRDGTIWIGTPGGLFALDPVSGRFTESRRSADDPRALGPGWVWAVLEDRHGRLWVGTGEAGLHRRREDGSFDRFAHDPDRPDSLSDNYVTTLLEDRTGTVWVGTRSGGLNAFDETSGRFTRYLPDPNDDRSISHHSVTALLESRDGTLWVGTGGGGVDRLEREDEGRRIRFERFTEADGLIDDNVVSLVEDDDGSLWVGTRRGLSRFDPQSGAFANFGSEDGLPSVEFQIGAATAGRSALFFGTHRGVVVVRRGTTFPSGRPSPTVLTAVRTPSGSSPGERSTWGLDTLEAPWGQLLSFEFATLDFGDRRRHRYAYRLEGVKDEWIDLGARREITFADLDPGSYVLHVKGRNDQGVWSETAAPLAIRIVPPFWMTGWFRAAMGIALVALVFGGHRLRTAALERRNRELVSLQGERERALDEARASQSALNAAYGRLRGLTSRLEAAKEDERRRIARELHDEMGQILTTAKLNLQLLSGLDAHDERERRIGDTIGLLDRMIGHVRTLSLDLRPPLLDELGLAAAIRGYVEAQGRRSGVPIELTVVGSSERVPPDIEIAAFRLIQEAITNVLRHAEARHVGVELRYDVASLGVRIRDDGQGFDVTDTFERAATGGHVGLLGIRERVESMGGTVVITSEPGHGAEIRASLPLPS